YALYAADLEPLLARYPQAAQYVAAYSAVTADYAAPGERPYPHQVFLADLVRDRAPLLCPASTPIREAALLLRESGAPTIALNERARAWILDNLAAPSALDWLAVFADLVNRRILERLLYLTGNDLPEQLWCFYGSAGRQELLTSVAPSIAVIGAVPWPLEAAL